MTAAQGDCQLCKMPLAGAPLTKDKKGRVFHRRCVEEYRRRKSGQTQNAASSALPATGQSHPPTSSKTVCNKCGATMNADAVLCVSCGFNRSTRKQVRSKRALPPLRGPILEFALFGIVFGALIFAPAALLFSSQALIRQLPSTGARLLIASIVGLPGLVAMLGGTIVAFRRNTIGVAICVIGVFLMPALSLGANWLAGVPIRFNCMTILMIGIPLIVASRISPALEAIKAGQPRR